MFHHRHGRHGYGKHGLGRHFFQHLHGAHPLQGDDVHPHVARHAGHDGASETARDGHHHGQGFSWHALWHGGGRPHRGGGHAHGGRGGARGFSGFGGFGGDDGDDGFARGRKFSSDDLQLLLLDLINSAPSHGYELIKALQTRSNGFYSPSPGMIYPALTYLEELGYVAVELEGNRKCYTLSDSGRDYLATHRERVDHLLAKLDHIAQRVEMMRRAMAGEDPLDPSAGGLLPEFHAARHALRAALMGANSADEQRRITAIIERATAEILAGAKPDADRDAD